MSDAKCSACGGPLAERPEHPYPVLLQLLFGASFVAFLFLVEKLPRPALVAWTFSQAALGVLLVRGRTRAKRRVLRCIRCGADLR
jgi:hypothetical protein